MPGRGLLGTRLLDQDMLVEELRAFRPHQPRRHRGRRRAGDEITILRDAPPIAVIAEKTSGRIVAGVVDRHRTGQHKVPLDPLRQTIEPVQCEDLAQHDHAVALESFDIVIRNQGLCIL